MRLAVAILALHALGCAGQEAPSPAEQPDSAGRPAASADDVATRGAAAGLTAAQAQQIADYGFGAVVPRLSPGWRLAAYRDESVSEAVTYPGYSLQYVHEDGRCFEIMAASEGLGDVFVIEPPRLEEADAPGVALFGPIPLGWSGPDETDDWGPDRLSTEWFGTDGLFLKLSSATEGGCRTISADDAREVLAGLRYLDPADDDAPAGHWEFVDIASGGPGALVEIPDPRAHALATFAAAEEEGTTSSVATLRAGPHVRVVLVTSEGLADDSIQAERTRVTYVRDMEGGWLPLYAGRQQRCREGRGHEGWGAGACV